MVRRRAARLWSVVIRVLAALALLTGQVAPSYAKGNETAVEPGGGRLALVIGNSDYRNVPSLKNPANDSRLISETLRNLGFDVVEKENLTRKKFNATIDEVVRKAKKYDSVLFYFAGHGFQLGGRNYLVPVDAKLQDRGRIPDETLQLDDIILRIQARNRQTLVFLDACRNNPIPASTAVPELSEGLAQMETGSGTFVAFATEPGNITRDGAGDNSPFSIALSEEMNAEGISISDMMIRVRNTVEERTLGTQTPWDQSSLRSQFYFNPTTEDSDTLTQEDLALLEKLDPALREKFMKRFGLNLDTASDAGEQEVVAKVIPAIRIEAVEPEEPAPVEQAAVADTPAPVPVSVAPEEPAAPVPAPLPEPERKPGLMVLAAPEPEPPVTAEAAPEASQDVALAKPQAATADTGTAPDPGPRPEQGPLQAAGDNGAAENGVVPIPQANPLAEAAPEPEQAIALATPQDIATPAPEPASPAAVEPQPAEPVSEPEGAPKSDRIVEEPATLAVDAPEAAIAPAEEAVPAPEEPVQDVAPGPEQGPLPAAGDNGAAVADLVPIPEANPLTPVEPEQQITLATPVEQLPPPVFPQPAAIATEPQPAPDAVEQPVSGTEAAPVDPATPAVDAPEAAISPAEPAIVPEAPVQDAAPRPEQGPLPAAGDNGAAVAGAIPLPEANPLTPAEPEQQIVLATPVEQLPPPAFPPPAEPAVEAVAKAEEPAAATPEPASVAPIAQEPAAQGEPAAVAEKPDYVPAPMLTPAPSTPPVAALPEQTLAMAVPPEGPIAPAATEEAKPDVPAEAETAEKAVPIPDDLTPEEQRDLAIQAQKELTRLGCYRSAIDGDWGARSARALLRFYAEQKLEPDDLEPTPELVVRLSTVDTVICRTTEIDKTKAKASKRSTPSASHSQAAPARSHPTASKPAARPAPAAKAAPRKAAPPAVAKSAPPAVAKSAPPAPAQKKLKSGAFIGAFR